MSLSLTKKQTNKQKRIMHALTPLKLQRKCAHHRKKKKKKKRPWNKRL